MKRAQLCVVLGYCFLGIGINAQAQSRKAGLWDVTSNMTWQQSPFPAGMSAGANSPFGGGTHTNTVCITQEQIDKFGAPPPQTRGDCQVSNLVKTANGMTAEMACTGSMSGKGTLVASWTDEDHTISKMHFSGTLQAGPSPKPVEWTVDSTSVFKSADCGNVKPIAPPGK
jgi:Protein of unknown function (DUF3617)